MAHTVAGSKKVRVLFLFLGLRRRVLLQEVAEGISPDTALRGMNYLQNDPALDVGYLDTQDVPAWIIRVVPFQFLPLMHLPRILRADIVIATDALFLGYVVSFLSRLRICRTRWIYIAINSSVLLRRHASHPVRTFLLRTCWSSYARIAYLAETQKNDFLRAGVPESRLRRIAFGIDEKFWSSAAQGGAAEELIASVGRDLGRDFGTLLKALRELPYHAIIATAKKCIPPDAPVPGTVDITYDKGPFEVLDLYSRAAAVVIALKDDTAAEGSDCTGQTVILETLAAGKPVIATKRSWLNEYLEDGKEYISVESYDAEGIARAVKMLMEDPDLRARIAAAGRERVRSFYTTREFARQLGELIAELQ